MKTALFVLCSATMLACGGATTAPSSSVKEPEGANGASSAGASGSSSPTTAAPNASGPSPSAAAARDPKILALANAAAGCKYEEGSFDEECPAFRAWVDEEALFEDDKGNDTVLSLLEDPEEKLRVVASRRGISDSEKYFADKGRGRRLYAMAKKETLGWIENDLGNWIARSDAAKLGLEAELREIAKKPSVSMRVALARSITHHQTPLVVELTRGWLADTEPRVQDSAISSLSSGGVTAPAEPVCKLLVEQLSRTDNLIGSALWAGSSSKCPGIHELVIAELTKRVQDPAKITNAVGIGFSLAAGGVCSRTGSDDLKKKGFEIGRKLVDAKVPDVNTRSAGIGVLKDCDPAAAEKTLGAFVKDKEKPVAERAKKTLDELKKTAKK